MHLDGYSESLRIAFEYQGRQHRELVPIFHKTEDDFKQRQIDDVYKKDLCKRFQITLMCVSDTLFWKDLPKYIENQIKLTRPELLDKLRLNIDMNKIDKDVYTEFYANLRKNRILQR